MEASILFYSQIVKRRFDPFTTDERLFNKWKGEYQAFYMTYPFLILGVLAEIISMTIGGTFIIVHKAPRVKWSPTVFWTGVGFLVAGGSLLVGQLILAGMGAYESQKRKKWLIDLDAEILKSTNQYLETIDFSQKFTILRANIQVALDELGMLVDNSVVQ
jgi:hypothetical protein